MKAAHLLATLALTLALGNSPNARATFVHASEDSRFDATMDALGELAREAGRKGKAPDGAQTAALSIGAVKITTRTTHVEKPALRTETTVDVVLDGPRSVRAHREFRLSGTEQRWSSTLDESDGLWSDVIAALRAGGVATDGDRDGGLSSTNLSWREKGPKPFEPPVTDWLSAQGNGASGARGSVVGAASTLAGAFAVALARVAATQASNKGTTRVAGEHVGPAEIDHTVKTTTTSAEGVPQETTDSDTKLSIDLGGEKGSIERRTHTSDATQPGWTAHTRNASGKTSFGALEGALRAQGFEVSVWDGITEAIVVLVPPK